MEQLQVLASVLLLSLKTPMASVNSVLTIAQLAQV